MLALVCASATLAADPTLALMSALKPDIGGTSAPGIRKDAQAHASGVSTLLQAAPSSDFFSSDPLRFCAFPTGADVPRLPVVTRPTGPRDHRNSRRPAAAAFYVSMQEHYNDTRSSRPLG